MKTHKDTRLSPRRATSLEDGGRRAVRFYEEVFGEPPEYEIQSLPGGDQALVLQGWLWLFPAGLLGLDRWVVRVKVPADLPGREGLYFRAVRAQLDGLEVEKPSLPEALVYLSGLEANRRAGVALLTQGEAS